ncbi:MAG: HlyD family secretion protein, partial [Saprospiraceae bacterium]|nr:HlyD family secretion protein [Saprospiraceae bacterium]
FVASLDKTELASKMTDVQTEIEKIQTQLAQAKIDTAIEMKDIRDQIANLEFSMQQEKLEIEKNRFEPQMIIEESRLKLEKSERDYSQLQEKLQLKKIQSDAKIEEIDANMRLQNNKMQQYNAVASGFNVIAPDEGMVIYDRNWNGKKGPGSQISAWDPVVAELPDLSEFISVIYVNEVDISKVKKGQSVKIKVDAFPEKIFEGLVNDVANIGQQLRNQDAKVFEVVVQVNEADSVLRPAMTTSNEVLVYAYDDVLSVPLEAYQKNDSLEFVVVKVGNGFVKREVVGHVSNSDEIVIAAGLDETDLVCLTFPDNQAELPIEKLDSEEKTKALEQIKVANAERAKTESENASKVKGGPAQRDMGNSGGFIIIG